MVPVVQFTYDFDRRVINVSCLLPPPPTLFSLSLSLSLSLMAASTGEQLRVFFFPFLSPGHMIPMLDMAILFSRRGVSATIITSPGNEPLVRPTIDRSLSTNHPITLLLLPFPPSVRHLLPGGAENLGAVSSAGFGDVYAATFALHQPLLDILRSHPLPDCLVSDSIYFWTADVSAELGIHQIVFHGPGIFALCVSDALESQVPHLASAGVSESDPFVVDGIPHRIELTRSQLPETFQVPIILEQRREGVRKSYGVVVNSFYELEPEYAELYRSQPGRRVWFVGPVSLCHVDAAGSANRAPDPSHAAADESGGWQRWLDGRPEASVLYVCFGSLCEFSADQLREIAAGLEGCGHPFVWVVRGAAGDWVAEEEGFKKRVEGRGLVIDGWAPQVLILNHPAVGGFVTHCGWNSTLEAVAAGVPMVAWPLFYEQFINEKLIAEVLRIGVKARRAPNGGGNVILGKGEAVTGEELAAAVVRLMGGGEEAEGIRRRAREYAVAARAALEEGGSSYEDMGRLIEDLVANRAEGGRKVADGGCDA